MKPRRNSRNHDGAEIARATRIAHRPPSQATRTCNKLPDVYM